jgi:hypothetical protein
LYVHENPPGPEGQTDVLPATALVLESLNEISSPGVSPVIVYKNKQDDVLIGPIVIGDPLLRVYCKSPGDVEFIYFA